MHVEIPMTDINDDRHRRLERCDVGKVLFGTNAQIHATLFGSVQELRDDVLKRRFVREKVVRPEYTVFLGKFFRQTPELLVGKFLRRCRSHWPMRDQLSTNSDRQNQACKS